MSEAAAARAAPGFASQNAYNGAYPEELFRPYQCANAECEALEPAFTEDRRSGAVICDNCGAVLPERLVDPGQEWRDFADSTDDKSRVSGVNDLLKGGLGTTITGDAGEFGKLHNRLIDNADRHILMASEKIDTLSNLLHIPDTIADRAKRIYKQFEDKRTKSMRYRHEGIIAAILYMACKEADFPRTFKELSRDTDIDENSIRKYYRMVNKLLERSDKRTSASDLVNRFCSKLKLDFRIIQAARHVADRAMQFVEGCAELTIVSNVPGSKSPNSIAAASILLVCKLSNEKRLERDIAEAASISHTTIRNVYKDLVPHQDVLLPPTFQSSVMSSATNFASVSLSPSTPSASAASSSSAPSLSSNTRPAVMNGMSLAGLLSPPGQHSPSLAVGFSAPAPSGNAIRPSMPPPPARSISKPAAPLPGAPRV